LPTIFGGSALTVCAGLLSVGRAADAEWATVQHMGVDHGGSDVVVAEQFLNRSDVMATFE
jgi:hypothetical protein